MEYQKHKMGQMRVAKFLIIFFSTNLSFSQDINGYYSFENLLEKREYAFKNSRFSVRTSISLNHGVGFSGGLYLIKDDTLFLFHEPIKNSNGVSQFEILEKVKLKEPNDIAIVDLEVLGFDLKPVSSSIISLYKNEDVLAIYPQADDARFFIQTQGKIATHIRVLNLERLDISLEQFWNYSSRIQVKLAKFNYDKYNSEFQIDKFLVQQYSDSVLVLIDSKGDKIALEKK